METSYFISSQTKYFRKMHYRGWYLFHKTSNSFWFTLVWPHIANHAEKPHAASPRPNFLPAPCFPSQPSIMSWHRWDSPLMGGCCQTASLLVHRLFGKSWWSSSRRYLVMSLVQKLLSPGGNSLSENPCLLVIQVVAFTWAGWACQETSKGNLHYKQWGVNIPLCGEMEDKTH